MKALLVIDVQKGFLEGREVLVDKISRLMQYFKMNDDKVIAFQHIDEDAGSPIEKGTEGAEIPDEILEHTDELLEKRYPISFKETDLDKILKEYGIDEVYITGFNMEFCILFTSIAAADRGYKVTVIEDLCGTENDGGTYEMDGLDIVDFIGTVIDWSGVIENKYLEETEFRI
ncbi:isochorismatase family protein [Lacicoccus qingdaonensis]|uniref:Nicotinamidase-related amidase n=1 Tax=Lacicoccus qingdaonensis TaxID=576118 RepID=A0A1G9B250_9BACL|nr:isochorismatase family protein [Salinicoccus qingdaonensis]SDK33666.1 Nicotinamidase-related amidase [Salinicoccus qingdaonensis]